MQISWVSVTVALSDTFLVFSTILLTVPSSPTYYYYYYYYYYECASKSTLNHRCSRMIIFLHQFHSYFRVRLTLTRRTLTRAGIARFVQMAILNREDVLEKTTPFV